LNKIQTASPQSPHEHGLQSIIRAVGIRPDRNPQAFPRTSRVETFKPSMSRGPGKVERAVERAVRRSSRALGPVHVEIEDVVSDAYDPRGQVNERQRRSFTKVRGVHLGRWQGYNPHRPGSINPLAICRDGLAIGRISS
jgi:hypothetical protein